MILIQSERDKLIERVKSTHPQVLLMEVSCGDWKDTGELARIYLACKLYQHFVGGELNDAGKAAVMRWLEAKESGGELFFVLNCPFCDAVMSVSPNKFHHSLAGDCVLGGMEFPRTDAKAWNRRAKSK